MNLITFFDPIPKYLTGHRSTVDITKEHFQKLDQAHLLTEQLYGIFKLSLVNKNMYKTFKDQRDGLSTQIVGIVTELQEKDKDLRWLNQFVDVGGYLKVFRVFFFYKPEVLTTKIIPDISNRTTILHTLAAPDYQVISVSFVKFILKMNKDHNLGLLQLKDVAGQTPAERTFLEPFHFGSPQEGRDETQALLLEADPTCLDGKNIASLCFARRCRTSKVASIISSRKLSATGEILPEKPQSPIYELLPLQSRWTKLPYVLKELVVSFISNEDFRTDQFNRCAFITEKDFVKLEAARMLTEKLYGALKCSLLNKVECAAFEKYRRKLSTQIVSIVTEIYDVPYGKFTLGRCVETSVWLKVLRVFFFYKPRALTTEITTINGCYRTTILHNAVSPNHWAISTPFVEFVLEMDKDHNLGLLQLTDYANQTPCQKTLRDPMPSSSRDLEARKMTQYLLKMADLTYSENPDLDSLLYANDDSPPPSPVASIHDPLEHVEENEPEILPVEPPSPIYEPPVLDTPVLPIAPVEPVDPPQPPRRNVVVSFFLYFWSGLCSFFRSFFNIFRSN